MVRSYESHIDEIEMSAYVANVALNMLHWMQEQNEGAYQSFVKALHLDVECNEDASALFACAVALFPVPLEVIASVAAMVIDRSNYQIKRRHF